MNPRLTGADLRGGGMAVGAPQGGPTGADLAAGGMAPPGGAEATPGLDEAIAAVIQAAQSVGFDLPAEGVPPEELPQVYARLLAAAAQSEMGRSPEGMQLIEQLAMALGVPPPSAGQGMPPPGAGAPPMQQMPPGAAGRG